MPEDREKQRLRVAKWRARNPEKVKEISKRFYQKKKAESPETIHEYQKSYRERNRQILCDKERERRFGITQHEYAELFRSQNGVCAICASPETATRNGKIKALAVDHCHKTGKVRGLLCSDCNTGIGKLKDSREILISAVRYLDGNSERVEGVVKLVPVK